MAAAEPTSLAVVGVNDGGAAEYAFYLQGTADWQWSAAELPARLPDDVLATHAGSLALALDPGADTPETRSAPACSIGWAGTTDWGPAR